MLSAVDNTQISQTFQVVPNMVIEVGPVKIPEYQNRPQIVIQNKDKTLTFSEFDRWGESLDISLARLINQDMALMLPGANIQMFPANLTMPIKYQIIVDVLQLKSELDKDIFLVVQWSILDVQNNKVMFTKRSEFRQVIDPPNYAGLAQTLSAVCISLSSEIAKEIASIAIPVYKK